MFPQLASVEEKRLRDVVNAKGGEGVFRNDNKMLLDLERTVDKVPSAKTKGGSMHRDQPNDTRYNTDDLRTDIFEDPNVAVEKNWTVFLRKFEAQKNQIVDELTRVVQRESDRVVRELRGSAHERILDQVHLPHSTLPVP